MRSKIIFFVLICAIYLSQLAYAQNEDEIFDLYLEITKDDDVRLLKFNVIEGTSNIEKESKGEYKIEVISKNNKKLFSSSLNLPFKVIKEVVDEEGNLKGEEIILDSIQHYFRLPFFEDADSVFLYHNNKKIFNFKVELCNYNGICEIDKHENYLSCKEDCPAGTTDNYCDGILDGECDKDCKYEIDIDCSCGNDICEEFENPATCRIDCKLTFWKWLINLIKSFFG